MNILNLTQHDGSLQQVEAGVIDLPANLKSRLVNYLTFQSINNTAKSELIYRADSIVSLVRENYPDITQVMIGGALFFMPVLISVLKDAGITPLFSFTERVVTEDIFPDGSVKKTSVFLHTGFVEA